VLGAHHGAHSRRDWQRAVCAERERGAKACARRRSAISSRTSLITSMLCVGWYVEV